MKCEISSLFSSQENRLLLKLLWEHLAQMGCAKMEAYAVKQLLSAFVLLDMQEITVISKLVGKEHE